MRPASLFKKFLEYSPAWAHVAALVPFFALGAVIMGLSAAPGFFLVHQTWTAWAQPFPAAFRFAATSTMAAIAYFLYGFVLLALIPACNFLLSVTPRPMRCRYYSVQAVGWYIHNALTYIMRFTFLDFITPTPFNLVFFRAMGMKIGHNTQINTTHVSDPALITIGSHTTVGGSATLLAHYGAGGLLVIAPVKIGDRVNIGLRATVMGNVEIGDGATLLPHSVALPGTRIPAGQTWGGVPAKPM